MNDQEPTPSERSSAADEQSPLDKDALFHILQNGRRRAVLRYLLAHNDRETFKIGDIAEAVAAWETDLTIQEVTASQRKRVYVSLYQHHLPKLASHGVIEYDSSRGTVDPTPRIDRFEPYLDAGSCVPEQSTDNSEEQNQSRMPKLSWIRMILARK